MRREGGDAQAGITTSRSFHSMSLTRSFSSFSAREICDVPSRTRMSTAVPCIGICFRRVARNSATSSRLCRSQRRSRVDSMRLIGPQSA